MTGIPVFQSKFELMQAVEDSVFSMEPQAEEQENRDKKLRIGPANREADWRDHSDTSTWVMHSLKRNALPHEESDRERKRQKQSEDETQKSKEVAADERANAALTSFLANPNVSEQDSAELLETLKTCSRVKRQRYWNE